jgi:hypothetical protein
MIETATQPILRSQSTQAVQRHKAAPLGPPVTSYAEVPMLHIANLCSFLGHQGFPRNGPYYQHFSKVAEYRH